MMKRERLELSRADKTDIDVTRRAADYNYHKKTVFSKRTRMTQLDTTWGADVRLIVLRSRAIRVFPRKLVVLTRKLIRDQQIDPRVGIGARISVPAPEGLRFSKTLFHLL